MDLQNDQISDEELAVSINDSGVQSSIDNNVDGGLLESGIHSDYVNEEKFSVEDFDLPADGDIDDFIDSDREDSALTRTTGTDSHLGESSLNTKQINKDDETHSVESDGDVAEFRKTLSDLSKQLEIDRITFLHKKLRTSGKSLPDLDMIASDIKGDKQLYPVGDEDLYSKRPFSRLQGWIVGLSFGIGRRAKKFRK